MLALSARAAHVDDESATEPSHPHGAKHLGDPLELVRLFGNDLKPEIVPVLGQPIGDCAELIGKFHVRQHNGGRDAGWREAASRSSLERSNA